MKHVSTCSDGVGMLVCSEGLGDEAVCTVYYAVDVYIYSIYVDVYQSIGMYVHVGAVSISSTVEGICLCRYVWQAQCLVLTNGQDV